MNLALPLATQPVGGFLLSPQQRTLAVAASVSLNDTLLVSACAMLPALLGAVEISAPLLRALPLPPPPSLCANASAAAVGAASAGLDLRARVAALLSGMVPGAPFTAAQVAETSDVAVSAAAFMKNVTSAVGTALALERALGGAQEMAVAIAALDRAAANRTALAAAAFALPQLQRIWGESIIGVPPLLLQAAGPLFNSSAAAVIAVNSSLATLSDAVAVLLVGPPPLAAALAFNGSSLVALLSARSSLQDAVAAASAAPAYLASAAVFAATQGTAAAGLAFAQFLPALAALDSFVAANLTGATAALCAASNLAAAQAPRVAATLRLFDAGGSSGAPPAPAKLLWQLLGSMRATIFLGRALESGTAGPIDLPRALNTSAASLSSYALASGLSAGAVYDAVSVVAAAQESTLAAAAAAVALGLSTPQPLSHLLAVAALNATGAALVTAPRTLGAAISAVLAAVALDVGGVTSTGAAAARLSPLLQQLGAFAVPATGFPGAEALPALASSASALVNATAALPIDSNMNFLLALANTTLRAFPVHSLVPKLNSAAGGIAAMSALLASPLLLPPTGSSFAGLGTDVRAALSLVKAVRARALAANLTQGGSSPLPWALLSWALAPGLSDALGASVALVDAAADVYVAGLGNHNASALASYLAGASALAVTLSEIAGVSSSPAQLARLPSAAPNLVAASQLTAGLGMLLAQAAGAGDLAAGVADAYASASLVAASVLQLATPAPGAATALAFASADVSASAPLLAAALNITGSLNGTWAPLLSTSTPRALFALSTAARSTRGEAARSGSGALSALSSFLSRTLNNASALVCSRVEDWLQADSGGKFGRMGALEVAARAIGAKIKTDPAYLAAAAGDGGAASAMIASTAHMAALNAEFSTYEVLAGWIDDVIMGPAAGLNASLAAIDAIASLLASPNASSLPSVNSSAWLYAFEARTSIELSARSAVALFRSLKTSATLLAGTDANGTLGADPVWAAALSSASDIANASLPAIVAALPALDATAGILASWRDAAPAAGLAAALPSLSSWAGAAENARHAATSLLLAAQSRPFIDSARDSARNGSTGALVATTALLFSVASGPDLKLALRFVGDAFNATQGLGANGTAVLLSAAPALAALRNVRGNITAVQATLMDEAALLDAELTMRHGFEGVLHLCRAAYLMADWSAGTTSSEGYFRGQPTEPLLLEVAAAPLLSEGADFVRNVSQAFDLRAPSAMLVQDDASRVAALLSAVTPLLWPLKLGNMGGALATLSAYTRASLVAENESTSFGWALNNLGMATQLVRGAVGGRSAGIDPSAPAMALSSATGFINWGARGAIFAGSLNATVAIASTLLADLRARAAGTPSPINTTALRVSLSAAAASPLGLLTNLMYDNQAVFTELGGLSRAFVAAVPGGADVGAFIAAAAPNLLGLAAYSNATLDLQRLADLLDVAAADAVGALIGTPLTTTDSDALVAAASTVRVAASAAVWASAFVNATSDSALLNTPQLASAAAVAAASISGDSPAAQIKAFLLSGAAAYRAGTPPDKNTASALVPDSIDAALRNASSTVALLLPSVSSATPVFAKLAAPLLRVAAAAEAAMLAGAALLPGGSAAPFALALNAANKTVASALGLAAALGWPQESLAADLLHAPTSDLAPHAAAAVFAALRGLGAGGRHLSWAPIAAEGSARLSRAAESLSLAAAAPLASVITPPSLHTPPFDAAAHEALASAARLASSFLSSGALQALQGAGSALVGAQITAAAQSPDAASIAVLPASTAALSRAAGAQLDAITEKLQAPLAAACALWNVSAAGALAAAPDVARALWQLTANASELSALDASAALLGALPPSGDFASTANASAVAAYRALATAAAPAALAISQLGSVADISAAAGSWKALCAPPPPTPLGDYLLTTVASLRAVLPSPHSASPVSTCVQPFAVLCGLSATRALLRATEAAFDSLTAGTPLLLGDATPLAQQLSATAGSLAGLLPLQLTDQDALRDASLTLLRLQRAAPSVAAILPLLRPLNSSSFAPLGVAALNLFPTQLGALRGGKALLALALQSPDLPTTPFFARLLAAEAASVRLASSADAALQLTVAQLLHPVTALLDPSALARSLAAGSDALGGAIASLRDAASTAATLNATGALVIDSAFTLPFAATLAASDASTSALNALGSSASPLALEGAAALWAALQGYAKPVGVAPATPSDAKLVALLLRDGFFNFSNTQQAVSAQLLPDAPCGTHCFLGPALMAAAATCDGACQRGAQLTAFLPPISALNSSLGLAGDAGVLLNTIMAEPILAGAGVGSAAAAIAGISLHSGIVSALAPFMGVVSTLPSLHSDAAQVQAALDALSAANGGVTSLPRLAATQAVFSRLAEQLPDLKSAAAAVADLRLPSASGESADACGSSSSLLPTMARLRGALGETLDGLPPALDAMGAAIAALGGAWGSGALAGAALGATNARIALHDAVTALAPAYAAAFDGTRIDAQLSAWDNALASLAGVAATAGELAAAGAAGAAGLAPVRDAVAGFASLSAAAGAVTSLANAGAAAATAARAAGALATALSVGTSVGAPLRAAQAAVLNASGAQASVAAAFASAGDSLAAAAAGGRDSGAALQYALSAIVTAALPLPTPAAAAAIAEALLALNPLQGSGGAAGAAAILAALRAFDPASAYATVGFQAPATAWPAFSGMGVGGLLLSSGAPLAPLLSAASRLPSLLAAAETVAKALPQPPLLALQPFLDLCDSTSAALELLDAAGRLRGPLPASSLSSALLMAGVAASSAGGTGDSMALIVSAGGFLNASLGAREALRATQALLSLLDIRGGAAGCNSGSIGGGASSSSSLQPQLDAVQCLAALALGFNLSSSAASVSSGAGQYSMSVPLDLPGSCGAIASFAGTPYLPPLSALLPQSETWLQPSALASPAALYDAAAGRPGFSPSDLGFCFGGAPSGACGYMKSALQSALNALAVDATMAAATEPFAPRGLALVQGSPLRCAVAAMPNELAAAIAVVPPAALAFAGAALSLNGSSSTLGASDLALGAAGDSNNTAFSSALANTSSLLVVAASTVAGLSSRAATVTAALGPSGIGGALTAIGVATGSCGDSALALRFGLANISTYATEAHAIEVQGTAAGLAVSLAALRTEGAALGSALAGVANDILADLAGLLRAMKASPVTGDTDLSPLGFIAHEQALFSGGVKLKLSAAALTPQLEQAISALYTGSVMGLQQAELPAANTQPHCSDAVCLRQISRSSPTWHNGGLMHRFFNFWDASSPSLTEVAMGRDTFSWVLAGLFEDFVPGGVAFLNGDLLVCHTRLANAVLNHTNEIWWVVYDRDNAAKIKKIFVVYEDVTMGEDGKFRGSCHSLAVANQVVYMTVGLGIHGNSGPETAYGLYGFWTQHLLDGLAAGQQPGFITLGYLGPKPANAAATGSAGPAAPASVGMYSVGGWSDGKGENGGAYRPLVWENLPLTPSSVTFQDDTFQPRIWLAEYQIQQSGDLQETCVKSGVKGAMAFGIWVDQGSGLISGFASDLGVQFYDHKIAISYHVRSMHCGYTEYTGGPIFCIIVRCIAKANFDCKLEFHQLFESQWPSAKALQDQQNKAKQDKADKKAADEQKKKDKVAAEDAKKTAASSEKPNTKPVAPADKDVPSNPRPADAAAGGKAAFSDNQGPSTLPEEAQGPPPPKAPPAPPKKWAAEPRVKKPAAAVEPTSGGESTASPSPAPGLAQKGLQKLSSGGAAYLTTQSSTFCGQTKILSLLGPEFNPFYSPNPVRFFL